MTKGQKRFAVFVIALLAIAGLAQQQYSGGSAVSVTTALPTGSNVIGHVIADTGSTTAVTGNVAVTGTFWQATQPTSLASLPALAAGTAKVGITYPYTSCGTTAVTAVLQALPTSATAVTGTTSCLVMLYLHNTSSSTAYTVTITDGQGTPVPFLNAATINPLETREYPFPAGGPKFTTGLKWSASNVAVVGAVEMMQ